MTERNSISFLRSYKETIIEHLYTYELKINKYRQNHECIYRENWDKYENDLIKFSKEYQRLLKERTELNQTNSWSFSVFDILKINRLEENLHSPILKVLLDPNGTHGQRDIFYKLFLQIFLSERRLSSFLVGDINEYQIICESPINNDSETGRIDILIKSLNVNKQFAILIENKWESGDSCPDQLFKYYWNLTKRQGYTDKNLLVFYLTKHGFDPTWIEKVEFEEFLNKNKGLNYFPISYNLHIRQWLQNCICSCKSEKVKSIIEQYLTYLTWHQ